MAGMLPILDHALPLMLVAFRLTGLFVFTPLIGGSSTPRMAKALLAMSLALAVYPAVPPASLDVGEIGLVTLVPLIFTELLLGAAIGLLASLPLIATQMAGHLMAYQMALSIASSYNPDLETEGTAISQMLFYLALASFLMLGGLDAVFASLLRSFEAVPVGSFATDMLPLDVLVGVLTSSFELAISVAAPVVGIVLLMLVAMGFLMKTMPQINVLSVGFAVKIMAGVAVLAAVLFVIDRVLADEVERVMALVAEWVGGLAGA